MMSQNPTAGASVELTSEIPGTLSFTGPRAAELFTRELRESYDGVMRKNYYSAFEGDNAGFISASIDGRPWTGTMWTRDAAVFLREMTLWGDLAHARLTAQYLMRMVQPNGHGFNTFPQHFELSQPGSGSELDGTAGIIIALVLLWERLPDDDPLGQRIEAFLRDGQSPLAYIHRVLVAAPLVPGTGEFGGGCGIPGEWLNVVQNTLCLLALLAAGRLERALGDSATAASHEEAAERVATNMTKYLVDEHGGWLWCIDPATLKADPAIINHPLNKGFGGLNGVACMPADVLGLEPGSGLWPGLAHSMVTFDRLLAEPRRREQFDKYGLWTQFDEHMEGYLTSMSYGHAYAVQTMLLFDRLAMAGRAIDWMTEATWRPPRAFPITRENPYWFYERYISPDAAGRIPWDEGCGALNLVNVAEPLKVARLILGVDDSSDHEVRLIPRLPPGWSGCVARDWPIRVGRRLVRADISLEREDGAVRFGIQVQNGETIPRLAIRIERQQGDMTWYPLAGISRAELVIRP